MTILNETIKSNRENISALTYYQTVYIYILLGVLLLCQTFINYKMGYNKYQTNYKILRPRFNNHYIM